MNIVIDTNVVISGTFFGGAPRKVLEAVVGKDVSAYATTEIIEEYNAEQDRTTIEKTFIDLMNLARSMSEEEQRYLREGFANDEELAIYDLLFSENLTRTDIKKVKEMSVDLLKKIKERIAEMDHWTDKQETRAAVDVLIRNMLYEEIPDSMFDRLEAYRSAIYEHVYTHYKQVA